MDKKQYFIFRFIRIIHRKTTLLTILLIFTALLPQSAICQVQPTGIQAKKFYSAVAGENNVIWFLTEAGVVSFDGTKWTLHNKNSKITSTDLKNVVAGISSAGPELLIASPAGAIIAASPVDEKSEATIFLPSNSKIASENVLAIAAGTNDIRWFGTDNGISAIKSTKWLTNNYERKYPADTFKDFPVTSMATTLDGDSLYAGTMGGGVLRVFRNEVDAISGASEYAQWGPIQMPSDNVLSLHISSDGTQWIGTDKGVAKHIGFKTLEGWTIYDTDSGLADNSVQAIASDSKGILYFGTKNGLSVLDGTKLVTSRIENGLVSNNILSIAVDKNNVVWIGTDNGISCLKNGQFINYQ